ncbi:MAG: universal stress protein [Gemmatimonadota bacterium]|nr:universal stress protein [Gemmatimonadota bacterium]MDH3422932.1 universal stress protein [Gemmatimonadota bacterium]
MYRQILVPLDGSAFAEAALPLALEITRRTGADLSLATVLEPVTSFAYEGWEGAAVEWSRQYLEDVLDRMEGQCGGELDHTVLNGHTVEMLQKEAEARSADLVVMASHGRGAFSRLWLGSVADGFVRQTHLPVILVRPDEDATPVEDFTHSFETLLIPLDGSELSQSAMAHATEFGELFDSAYHLTRVVTYPIDLASPYLPHTAQLNQKVLDDAKEGAAKYLEERAEEMRRRGLRVTTSVAVDAQAGQGILAETEAVGADMVAMATHGRKGLSRVVLGSAADKVLRGLHKPLLLHRPNGVDDS